MKKILMVALLGVGFSGLANAGAYVGASVNANQSDASIPEAKVSSGDSVGLGLKLGYSHSFGNVYLAGEYSYSSTAGKIDVTDQSLANMKIKGEVESSKSLNLKVGYAVTPGVTLYGVYGRGSADMKWSSGAYETISSFDTQTMGAGLIYDIGKSVSVTGELRQLSNVNGTADLDVRTVDAGVMYRF